MFVLRCQWWHTMFLSNIDTLQHAIHHNEFKYTLLLSMLHMHMNRLMLIGVEVEYKSKIFVYFRHVVVIVSRCKDTNKYSSSQKNVVMQRKRKYSPQNMRRIIALPVIQNKIRRFNRRRQSDELEHQAQYVFLIFLRFMSSSFYQFHAYNFSISSAVSPVYFVINSGVSPSAFMRRASFAIFFESAKYYC